ncbi:MAG: pyridoxal-phosphate dependent enzyme [Gemmatimonadetes bacterium]|uniref:Pyridoxal-phosphate dependent enzyme n=1 Tax=Candidatus Kutchimonas denitrificans TaxID=3056748 RepID=A0AAE4Z889_9BACT|nr:pyridoxal-phosphate dependent enzyme [Gemmatimonadota bacterium]NIR75079.1 pyridoxal-phosphate dependent enzyme [Candidatus Kutchimonas denitrificans]NIS00911.1 pyridoxal-phosphate dependent enzyme [Gemmatimonadota bacterium]NIT66528.1 pyridoxal-phosphate dependent enzyme [Gemmatimonadota bacterium]NIU52874.1 pyridoxal-phosphate dependent enzyme [Gemmatimonadota bacterium]
MTEIPDSSDKSRPEIPLSARGIVAAHEALKAHLFETPLLPSPRLFDSTGAHVYLKAENIQRTGSFKVRGSVNKLRKLVESGAVPEVTAASAGNHAQGMAYAATRLGIECVIFMPEDAPLAKRRNTEELGARLEIVGANYDESRAAALEYADQHDSTFIDGFDDWDVIEGQGTIGVELAGTLGDRAPDYVLIPAGGGGLMAGVLFYLKEIYGDRTKVIGIQSDRAPALMRSLQRARAGDGSDALPLDVATQPTIADGVRVGQPGQRPFEVIRRLADGVICVGEEAVYDAIVFLYEHARLVVEGAGALGVAALMSEAIEPEPDSLAVVLLSGGNVDLRAMQKLVTSYLYKSGRRIVLRIKVKDLPGQLTRVLDIFERARMNVAEIEQPPILGKPLSPEYTVFDLCVETEGERQISLIMRMLDEERERMREEGVEPFEVLQR